MSCYAHPPAALWIARRLRDYALLARFHRPIGTLLILWPALWGLWLAGGGHPAPRLVAIFVAGAFAMRAAGCAINDFADRHFDGRVRRTRDRPLAQGRIRPAEALGVWLAFSLVALWLVSLTNPLTIALAAAVAAVVALYPFCKRFTHYPQLVLGIAWASCIPLAFAAQTGEVPPSAWVPAAGVVAWTVAFDTFYAMADREDDRLVGIRSTALRWGRHDLAAIALCQLLALAAFAWTGALFGLGAAYWAGLAAVAALFAGQLWKARSRGAEAAFAAFLANRWVGLVLFAATAADGLLS